MKNYPLEIQTIGGDYPTWTHFSKGHHDEIAFRSAIEKYEGGPIIDGRAVRQTWLRLCQTGWSRQNEYAGEYKEYPGPGKGIFPATVLDVRPTP